MLYTGRVPIASRRARLGKKRSFRLGNRFRRDVILTRLTARTIVAEFMVKTGSLVGF